MSRTTRPSRHHARTAALAATLLVIAFAITACGGGPTTRIGATAEPSTTTPSTVTAPSSGSSATTADPGTASSSPAKKVSDVKAPQATKTTACSVLTKDLATDALGADAEPDTTANSPVPGAGACSYLASSTGARVTLLLINDPVAVKGGLGKPSALLTQSCKLAGFTLTTVPEIASGAVQCANGTKTQVISQEDIAWEIGDLGLTIEFDAPGSTKGIAKDAAVDLAKKLAN